MKKQLPGFFAGIFVTVIAFATIPALAASFQTIEATLNSVNIKVNGAQVASVGEDYTLDNGKQTAGSIVFNETTYVPIRRIGDLLGADIGWDQSSSSVTIQGGENATPTTPVPADYSNWSADEEEAYQEFKGVWDIEDWGISISSGYNGADEKTIAFGAMYNGTIGLEQLRGKITNNDTYKNFFERMCYELINNDVTQIVIKFGHKDGFNDSFGRAILNSGGFYILGWDK